MIRKFLDNSSLHISPSQFNQYILDNVLTQHCFKAMDHLLHLTTVRRKIQYLIFTYLSDFESISESEGVSEQVSV